MENTIMTEKIARRGIYTPDSYEPDVLRKLSVAQVISNESMTFSPHTLVKDIKAYLESTALTDSHFIVTDHEGHFLGTAAITDLYVAGISDEAAVSSILKKSTCVIKSDDSLSKAVELMSEQQQELIPVVSTEHKFIGILTYKDILKAYKIQVRENREAGVNLSLKRQRMKMLIKGRNFYKVSKTI
jgi:Mg/Co/Ni transporter MgtE